MMQPEVGDIWVWDGNADCPLLLIEQIEGEPLAFHCLDLAKGAIYGMYFDGIMDMWARVA